ncbi:MAG: hypothetical protein M1816_002221 [Peltula sp. TS41687]|nr:MAG: hypothetical protein M1816_002221 [Peltula sp. TS41687]
MGGKRKRRDKSARQSISTSDTGKSPDTPDPIQNAAPHPSTGNPATDERDPEKHENTPHDQETGTNDDGWEVVASQRLNKKRKKVPKKTSTRYPAITFSSQSRLNSAIKISDLQGLVLYIFGQDTAPQWVSVRHHSEIRKIVVLMVPGLERGMFNGSINLAEKPAGTIGGGKIPQSLEMATSGNVGGEQFPLQENSKPSENGPRKSHANNEDSSATKGYRPTELSQDHLQHPLRKLAGVFPHMWPASTPGDDKYCRMHSPIHAMLISPLPKDKEDGKMPGVKPPREAQSWQNQPTRITEFLASVDQLQENEYAVHPAHLASDEERLLEKQRRQKLMELPGGEWIDSRVSDLNEAEVPEDQLEQGGLTAGREVLAMDCEMCRTSDGELALTRISLLSWDGEVVMDELIKPALPIVDYLTEYVLTNPFANEHQLMYLDHRYSGITQAMLEPIQMTLTDVQSRLLDLLRPRTILMGHSLNVDLAAIRISHPFIIDTSIIYPHTRGPPLKASLKWLTKKYLGRDIQAGHGTTGHSPIEDARACLDLVKQKCEKGPLWGTSEASSESIFKRIGRTMRPVKHMDGASAPIGRVGAVVDWGRPERGVGAWAKYHIGCQNDEEVVEGIKTATLGSENGEIVPAGGVDFVWARMRTVEFVQGWRNGADLTNSGGRTTSNLSEPADLSEAVTTMVDRISTIYENLPPCTAFIVYSGSGDPREMTRLQALKQEFRKEYTTKKWDQLTVKWTDTEDQQLRAATRKARDGLAMMTVK